MLSFHICSPDHQCAKNDVDNINAGYEVGTSFVFHLEDGQVKMARHIQVQFA